MNTDKKTTKSKKQPNKKDMEIHKEETFAKRIGNHYLSTPMRPTLVGLVILVVYFLVRPKPETDLDFSVYFIILGLAISATGLIAIRRKGFPGWISMYTGAAAPMFGWLSLTAGIILITQEVLRIIR